MNTAEHFALHLKANLEHLSAIAKQGMIERAEKPGTMAREAYARHCQLEGLCTIREWADTCERRQEETYALALAAALHEAVTGEKA